MKHMSLLLSAAALLLSSCGTNKEQNNTSTSKTDTTRTIASTSAKKMTAQMSINSVIEAGDPFELQFTVYNRSAGKQSFCKWQTPFEPPMSKYLDIKDALGTEVQYQGIMAKRIMPPPADSYIEVKSGDSLSVKVDLSKAYKLNNPGTYTVHYNSQEISGLHVKDSISFIYKK